MRNRLVLLAILIATCAPAQSNPPVGDQKPRHYARGTYRLLNDGQTAYLTLPGQGRPFTLRLQRPNVYVTVDQVPALMYTELSSATDPEADGLFVVNMPPGSPAAPQSIWKEAPGSPPTRIEPHAMQRPADVVIELGGTWQAQTGGVVNSQILQISIHQEADELTAAYTKPDAYAGHVAFHGRYSGQHMFLAKTEGSQRAPAAEVSVTVTDPDTLLIVGSGSVTYRRASDPKLNDLPCDRRNPYRVVNYQALARADVAADAGQFSTAFCWALIAADTKNSLGQFIVGGYLRKGLGTDRNLEEAFTWLSLSAKQGQLDAQRSLAEMYRTGEGAPSNPALAKYWQDQSEETLAAQKRFEQGRQLLNSATIVYVPPEEKPPCRFPCRDVIGFPDLGDFVPAFDPNAKALPPIVLKGARAAAHVIPIPERKTTPARSGPRTLVHFARGQYKITKDDSRAYITLPGAQKPTEAQFSSEPNIFVVVAWSGRVTALKEVSAPGDPDADGLFSLDMGMDPHIAVRRPEPTKAVIELDGQWDAEVNHGGHSEIASMTLHHEGALLWAIESTSGSRNFGKRAFSGFYSGEQSFPIQPAPELSGIAGETTLRLQDADTLLVYGLIFHRVK